MIRELRANRVPAISLLRVLLFWVTTMAVLAAASAVANGQKSALLIGALTVPATAVLTLLFLKWEGASLRDYGFDFSGQSCLRFGAGLLIGIGLVATHTLLLTLGGAVHWVRTSALGSSNLLLILAYVLLAAREELAFRGYPLRKLASDLNPAAGLLIVAMLFAIEHRLAGATWPNALLGSGVGALVFGMAALATRGLALPIGLHAAWNIGDWARGGKGDGGLWRMIVDPASANGIAIWAMISYIIVMALAFVALWLWHRRLDAAQRANPAPAA